MSDQFTGRNIGSTDMPSFYESSPAFEWPNGMEAALPDMRLQGDFYRESEDVTRGVTLAFPDVESAPFGAFGSGEDFYSMPMPGKLDAYNLGSAFEDSVLPPVAPYDNMSATSLLLKAESPAALAQSIHEFLRAEPGEILKVSTPKFAVKADIFQAVNGNHLFCRVKARVYRQDGSKNLVVDFCRRTGDAVAFQRTFQRAAQHLLTKFAAADETNEAAVAFFDVALDAPPLPSDAMGMDFEGLMLVPLLDMLQGDASLAQQAQQAEAVAALATVAGASTASAVAVCAALGQLSQPGILEACRSSCRTEVSYPAARLQSVLRECGYAPIN